MSMASPEIWRRKQGLLVSIDQTKLSAFSPGTGQPGGLPSVASHRVRHDRSDLAAAAAFVPFKEKAVSLMYFLSSGVLKRQWL